MQTSYIIAYLSSLTDLAHTSLEISSESFSSFETSIYRTWYAGSQSTIYWLVPNRIVWKYHPYSRWGNYHHSVSISGPFC